MSEENTKEEICKAKYIDNGSDLPQISRKNLIAYLKEVLFFQAQIDMAKQTIEKVSDWEDAYEQTWKENYHTMNPKPINQSPKRVSAFDGWRKWVFLVAAFLSVGLIYWFFAVQQYNYANHTNPVVLIIGFIVGVLPVVIPCCVVIYFVNIRRKTKNNKQIKKADEGYRQEMVVYNERDKQFEAIKNNHLKYYEQSANEITTSVYNPLVEKLNELYSQGILYEDYQNSTAVAYILKFLESGRCDSLYGPHGAYNRYDTERYRIGVISSQAAVLNCLKDIRNQQDFMIDALKDVKSSVDNITNEIVTVGEKIDASTESLQNSLYQIEENSRVAAWASAVSATQVRDYRYTAESLEKQYR